MKLHTYGIGRPAVWGFFVCLLSMGAAKIISQVVSENARSTWVKYESHSDLKVQATVVRAFQEKYLELFRIIEHVKSDSALFTELRRSDEQGTVEAFSRLSRYSQRYESTIDIVDPRGTIVAWSGRSISSGYERFLPHNGRDSLVVILQNGLHTYVSAGVLLEKKDFYLIASKPLELQFPISNKFVSRISFSDELSRATGTEVRIALNATTQIHSHEKTRFVPLRDLDGRTIAYAFFVPFTLDTILQSVETESVKWVRLFSALAILFFAVAVWQISTRFPLLLLRVTVLTVLTWFVRITWRMLDFPGELIGGSFFSATVYSSPFYFGLTTSVGELFVSSCALCLNSMAVWYNLRGHKPFALRGLKSGLAWIVGMVLFFALFIWGVRGYAEAIRTFVFDSTLEYQNASALVPDVYVSSMYVNILLLTTAVLGILTLALQHVKNVWLGTRFSTLPWWLASTIMFGCSFGLFMLVSSSPQFPLYHPILIFAVGIGIVELLTRNNSSGSGPSFAKTATAFILSSFIVAMPVLDVRLHEKERQQVRTLADTFFRPVDSWLSFVLTEGLRTVGAQFQASLYDPQEDRSNSMAFSLWARTLMSHEGYNSGVIVYAPDGKELSRFSVGMTTFEQKELLKKLFDGEEETVQVIERIESGTTEKSYGLWSTQRDENNRLLGSVALMLSASQRALFRGEAIEAIRPVSPAAFESSFREVAVSEFRRDRLVSTTMKDWYGSMPLSDDVVGRMEREKTGYVWKTEIAGSRKFESLYAAPEGPDGRIIVVSLESLDLRWHLLNVLKAFMIYAALLLGLALGHWLFARRKSEVASIGFRGKLVSAFGILGIIPLFLLGYYNREVASERLQENITRTLTSDLELVEQRILGAVLDEEDFQRGVNSDFCEVIAAEIGVDFAVFRRSELLSSSRPELYQSRILDSRLPGRAFANVVLLEKALYVESETVGEVEYAVGYKPVFFEKKFAGVIAVPTLYRQREIEEELAQRNAFVFGVYAVALGLVLVMSFVVANRLSRPIRELTKAADEVGKGNLDVSLKPTSSDEVGNLTRTFNEMVRELKTSREEQKRSEREMAWKEMAKQVAHEIKNPLTPMRLSVQHLRQVFKEKARNRESILQQVSKILIDQIDALSRIATEFSRFAKMPERKFERIDIQELLAESVLLFRDVRGIEFRTKFSDTAIHLVADKDELRRVFINIFRNGVQAMERGGVITVESSVEPNRCVVRISDTGIGIPRETGSKVFEPNFSTKTDGMGLGLAISQRAIQDLGGTITYQSVPLKGTTFEISLPV